MIVLYFNGERSDYAVASVMEEQNHEVDQFRYVLECFKEDELTRRAIVSIEDPMKDDFDKENNLKKTLDIPCTRMLHFTKDVSRHTLNLVVSMRSNDVLWGASAVNIFNFTFIQEYFAAMLNMKVGSYFHVANNFHFYADKKDKVKQLAESETVEDVPYEYEKTFRNLQDFDSLVKILCEEEARMRLYGMNYKYYEFEDPFFRDWYNVLYVANTSNKVDFVNPIMTNLRYSKPIY